METKGFDLFFQGDEENYLDDPITLLDFEEDTVFSGSEKYLRNVTIEDPGYIVNISLEDELRIQKSLSNLKELRTSRESSGYSNKNGYLLRQCRTCSIKVVDCNKFPWYYRNKLGFTNNIQHPKENSEKNLGDELKEEIIIIDLTENEHLECKNSDDNIIQEKYTNNIDKDKANCTDITSVDNSIDLKVRKQTYKRLFKPALNIQNESHTKVARREVDQATNLIISTYTNLTDKAIQNLKNNIESCENSKNINHNLGKNLLIDCKSLTNTREKLKDTKNDQKVAKVSTDNITNKIMSKVNHKKNKKITNKLKNVYTSEQISKTKIKIKKSALRSKDIIANKRNFNEKEGKECNLNLNTTNREQYDSLKKIDKNHNLFNMKQQNREQNSNHQNKEEKIQRNSYSYLSLPSPVLTTIITETKNFTSLSNQNNLNPDKINGCNKQVFSADRIIPHFHDKAFLNLRDNLSKNKSNAKHPKLSKDTINNYEIKKYLNRIDSKDLNLGPMVTQITNRNIQRNNDFCIGNNNEIVNNNEFLKKIYNTNVDISNISTMNAVNSPQLTYNLPVNNGIIFKRSTHASSNVFKENVNNIDLINQSKDVAQEEERLRYLLPSNLPDSHNQNIFKL